MKTLLHSVFVLSVCAGFAPAQDLMNLDFSATFPSYSYGYAYAGQGTPDCMTNVANNDQTASMHEDPSIAAGGDASATGDFTQWVIDPNACWKYAGVGVGVGHVLGYDNDDGGVTYDQKFTSNDLSQYTLSYDVWMEGWNPFDPAIGLQQQINVQMQGPDRNADGGVMGMASMGFNDTNSTTFITGTPTTFTYTLDQLPWIAEANGTTFGFATYADYQAGAWDEITQIQFQVQVQVNGADADLDIGDPLDADNVIRIDNVVINAPFDVIDNGGDLVCDFDADTDCDFDDLDLLYDNWGAVGGIYDVDGSGTVDAADITPWLASASDPANTFNSLGKTFVMGDVNLDGSVDSTDLGLLLNNFGSTDGQPFDGGNLNDDPNVDSTDLGLLLNNFGSSSAAGAAVPEPGSLPLLLTACAAIFGFVRRR